MAQFSLTCRNIDCSITTIRNIHFAKSQNAKGKSVLFYLFSTIFCFRVLDLSDRSWSDPFYIHLYTFDIGGFMIEFTAMKCQKHVAFWTFAVDTEIRRRQTEKKAPKENK